MKKAFALFVRAWKEMDRFNSLKPELRSIVFYAEEPSYWTHFEPIITEICETHRRHICYLTSSPDDPILSCRNSRIHSFYIGSYSVRTILFKTLKAGVMVMTMPDLETFHIKRSKYPVHYVYVHHSMVSTHRNHCFGAFDHFDSILCVGPYHVKETLETEALYGLKPKKLIKHGYGRLDSILQELAAQADLQPVPVNGRVRVLVAPSWGDKALLEFCGVKLMDILLSADYFVTVRPHPITTRKHPKILTRLKQRFGKNSNFILELDVSSKESLYRSNIMISDWSGSALEFAFGLERPVLFIDVPEKINNPEYKKLSCVPIEVEIRSKLGAIVSTDCLEEIPKRINELCADPMGFRDRIQEIRSRIIYNVGTSGSVAADYILQVAENVRETN